MLQKPPIPRPIRSAVHACKFSNIQHLGATYPAVSGRGTQASKLVIQRLWERSKYNGSLEASKTMRDGWQDATDPCEKWHKHPSSLLYSTARQQNLAPSCGNHLLHLAPFLFIWLLSPSFGSFCKAVAHAWQHDVGISSRSDPTWLRVTCPLTFPNTSNWTLWTLMWAQRIPLRTARSSALHIGWYSFQRNAQ